MYHDGRQVAAPFHLDHVTCFCLSFFPKAFGDKESKGFAFFIFYFFKNLTFSCLILIHPYLFLWFHGNGSIILLTLYHSFSKCFYLPKVTNCRFDPASTTKLGRGVHSSYSLNEQIKTFSISFASINIKFSSGLVVSISDDRDVKLHWITALV